MVQQSKEKKHIEYTTKCGRDLYVWVEYVGFQQYARGVCSSKNYRPWGRTDYFSWEQYDEALEAAKALADKLSARRSKTNGWSGRNKKSVGKTGVDFTELRHE